MITQIESKDMPPSAREVFAAFKDATVEVMRVNSRGELRRLGSGFFLKLDDDRIFAVTNYHVVQGQPVVKLRTTDDMVMQARLAVRNPTADLAVLEVIPSVGGKPPKSISQSALSRTTDHGEQRIAIGYPDGSDKVAASLNVAMDLSKSNPRSRAFAARMQHEIRPSVAHSVQTETPLQRYQNTNVQLISDSTMAGHTGLSGSPVFNAKKEIVGVFVASPTKTLGATMIGPSCLLPMLRVIPPAEKLGKTWTTVRSNSDVHDSHQPGQIFASIQLTKAKSYEWSRYHSYWGDI